MGEQRCNASQFGIEGVGIRHPGAPGYIKIPYDSTLFLSGISKVASVVIDTTDPSSSGPFGIPLVNDPVPPSPVSEPFLVLPQEFTLTLGGVSAFVFTVVAFDEDGAAPASGVTVKFGPQTTPPDTAGSAWSVAPCTVFT